jgi:hypothetical protein
MNAILLKVRFPRVKVVQRASRNTDDMIRQRRQREQPATAIATELSVQWLAGICLLAGVGLEQVLPFGD